MSKNSKELKELNDILQQQIEALRQLIVIKDQIIHDLQTANTHHAITNLWPQVPYQPTVTWISTQNITNTSRPMPLISKV
jgi:hypothetical protein